MELQTIQTNKQTNIQKVQKKLKERPCKQALHWSAFDLLLARGYFFGGQNSECQGSKLHDMNRDNIKHAKIPIF